MKQLPGRDTHPITIEAGSLSPNRNERSFTGGGRGQKHRKQITFTAAVSSFHTKGAQAAEEGRTCNRATIQDNNLRQTRARHDTITAVRHHRVGQAY